MARLTHARRDPPGGAPTFTPYLGAMVFDLPFALRPAKLSRLSGQELLRWRELAAAPSSARWARRFAACALTAGVGCTRRGLHRACGQRE